MKRLGITTALLALALTACSHGGTNQPPLPPGVDGQAKLILPGFTIGVSDYWQFLHSSAYDWSVYCGSTGAPEPLANFIKGIREKGLTQGVKLDNTSINLAARDDAPGLLMDNSFVGSGADASTASKLVAARCAELK